MNRHELPTKPRMIRKSAYGRTELFLPSTGVQLREVKCMSGITQRDDACVYHLLPDACAQPGVCCWHCCEEITNEHTRVPLPRVYDSSERVFHVYGCTCSPACAKAYILEHTTFDRGQQLNVLTKMLREVFGVTWDVCATPPRPALKRFGGFFDPKKQVHAECRMLEPPFVSYCMIVEERATTDINQDRALAPTPMDEETTLDEPQGPALYEDFMKSVDKDAASSSALSDTPKVVKRKRNAKSTNTGPMARFVNKPDEPNAP